MEEQLLFLIGPPRSGSTMLAHMLGSHADVFAPQEPHLLTPLAHLGYYERVEKAPYDPVITQTALRQLVGALPNGEDDYLDALRAATDILYRRLLEPTGRRLLLDKTPAYALVLDFIARLYPRARYLVLTRNPLAVWTSYAESFFDGDHAVAQAHNPLLERYVPAIARFLRERPVSLLHVRYEELVTEPTPRLERICEFSGLRFDPAMVEYGRAGQAVTQAADGLGDPITVARESRPTTRSVERWTRDLAGNAPAVDLAARTLAGLTDADLETWGYSRRELEAQLDAVDLGAPRPKRRRLTRYTAQRKLLVLLRRDIHHNALGRLLRRVRTACDVLLR